MLKKLVKVADRLDSLGLMKEADVVDKLINKIASDLEYTGEDEFAFDDPEGLQAPTMYWGELNVYDGPLVSKEIGRILDQKFRDSGGRRTREELFEQLMELGWNGETDPDKSNWTLNRPLYL